MFGLFSLRMGRLIGGMNLLLKASCELRDAVGGLSFGDPVTHVYNPLKYAWAGYEAYVSRFGRGKKRVVFLGMNPGPFGMTQTGVPFGAIPAVRDWMEISVKIQKPKDEHPKRPIEGFACKKVEVSGRRLWLELFAERFPQAGDFFADHFVLNYCPLVFMTETGTNFTPDKLKVSERQPLEEACDLHLQQALEILSPEWVIGVGAYAESNLQRVLPSLSSKPKLERIIHPAPASPMANREWPVNPREKLISLGIWSRE